jgi:hypothetical protein
MGTPFIWINIFGATDWLITVAATFIAVKLITFFRFPKEISRLFLSNRKESPSRISTPGRITCAVSEHRKSSITKAKPQAAIELLGRGRGAFRKFAWSSSLRYGRLAAKDTRLKHPHDHRQMIQWVSSMPRSLHLRFPFRWGEISSITSKGPIVILLATEVSASAIIIRSSSPRVIRISLTHFNSPTNISYIKNGSWGIYDKTENIQEQTTYRNAREHAISGRTGYLHMLEGVWRSVVCPIMDALDFKVRNTHANLPNA